ncbi:MAG: YkgJ family cysteine cluster protein [Myxococcales bacterium]|nr:YkgJ family cysteine cluster protein [Myxococcales bacterium]
MTDDREARLVRLRVHLQLIDRDVAPVVARHREHIQCKPGCGDCCHQSFRVSALEGELLREGLAALDPAPRDRILARARAYAPDRRVPCPALDDGARCLLYEHRPRLCRKYGIPLWHPDRPHEVTTCALNFRGVTDIDAEAILEPQAEWARDWIRTREDTGTAHGDVASIAEHLLVVAPRPLG